jgi:hypothetical protein
MKAFVLLFICLLGGFYGVEASKSSRVSFLIKPGDEGALAVKITTTEAETLTCSFKYSTKRRNSAEDEKDSATSVRRPSVQTILGRLSGICIRKTIDYWKYELCFEGDIKQVHGQVQHNLGRYAGLDGPLQLYDEGTPCESKTDKNGRRTKVEFWCDKQLRIRSVEEVQSCSYVMIVGTPIVCGSSEFAIAPADSDGDGASSQNFDELWMLEMAQVSRGRAECSVRALTGDVRARPERPSLTTLEFSRFELDTAIASDSPATMYHDMHVVRAPDRLRLSSSEREYHLQANSAVGDRHIGLKSGDSFLGLLEYIQLIVRILDSSNSVIV